MTMDLINLRKALGKESRQQMIIIWKYTIPSNTAMFFNSGMTTCLSLRRLPIQKP